MIANRKEFYGVAAMMVVFLVVLGLFFAPLYSGHNGLAYLDNLYNSISKGSANYNEMVLKTAQGLRGTEIVVPLKADSDAQLEVMATLLRGAQMEVTSADGALRVAGDLGVILESAVKDAEDMYYNRGDALTERYGLDASLGLNTWWHLLGRLEKQLEKQKLFAAAKDVHTVITRGVETAYNYYGVEAQSISQRIGVVCFSLVFYVVYTLWYGFAILFMFEGWGLKLEH